MTTWILLVDSSAHDFTVLYLILDRVSNLKNTVYFKETGFTKHEQKPEYTCTTQRHSVHHCCVTRFRLQKFMTVTSPISDSVAKIYFHEIIF